MTVCLVVPVGYVRRVVSLGVFVVLSSRIRSCYHLRVGYGLDVALMCAVSVGHRLSGTRKIHLMCAFESQFAWLCIHVEREACA